MKDTVLQSNTTLRDAPVLQPLISAFSLKFHDLKIFVFRQSMLRQPRLMWNDNGVTEVRITNRFIQRGHVGSVWGYGL